MGTTTQRPKTAQFTEIKSGTGTSLFVSKERADHPESMKILDHGNLRPLTYREAFVHHEELLEELQGKWFYLAGKGIKESEIRSGMSATMRTNVYTFDEQG